MPANRTQGDDNQRLEFHISDGDSIPPTDPKAQQLKSWANIIATTAALVTAVIAAVKPQDQTVNRNTYDQLKASIEQTNQEVKQNHDDMVALHNYLEGYFANNPMLPPLSGAGPVFLDAGAPTFTRGSRPAPHPTVSIPAASVFPLPDVHPPSASTTLPPFDSLAAKK